MEFVKHYLRRDFQTYTDGISIQEELISISFKNIGTVDANINGFPLLVNDPMITFGNEVPSEDITTFDLTFASTPGAKRVIAIKTRISKSVTIKAKPCQE